MDDRKSKPSRDELIKHLKSPGWSASVDAAQRGTLEDLAKAAHERHKNGEDAGLLKDAENELEVDLVQLQELWAYMGLPR